MNNLSARVAQMAESETLAMARLSRELKAQGKDIISLSLGEPDFDTPEFIREAAKEAIDNHYSHYPPVPGYASLRETISNKFKRDNDLVYSPDQVVVSTGAKQSLINVVLSLVNPGDEIILPAPYWVSYAAMAQLAEANAVVIPTTVEEDFKITPKQLEESITEKSKLMIFSTPCNPSGSVYTRKELRGLADVIVKYPNLFVISDEIYEVINFENKHASLAGFDDIYPQVITVNGVSKGFAMTGWRIGYIGAPKWIADGATKIQGQFTSGANGIAQKAAEAAIKAEMSSVNYMKQAFLNRKELVLSKLNEIPGFKCNVPKGAFYVFPDVRALFGKTDGTTTIENAADLCTFFLNDAGVALVPGDAFGTPGCIRISYAASEDELTAAMDRMKESVLKLS